MDAVILNLTAEIGEAEEIDGWGGRYDAQFVVVKVNGHEIARSESGVYLGRGHGVDQREYIEQVAADLLKELLESDRVELLA
jgi:hypothetical protein